MAKPSIKQTACLALLLGLALAPKAHAYIDPGDGNFYLQALIGGGAAVVLALKGYWKKLWGFLRRKRGP